MRFFFHRPGYYTIPSLAELNQRVDADGDLFVDDFIVGRVGYGKAKFLGTTNVAALNLDEIGEQHAVCVCHHDRRRRHRHDYVYP